MIIAQITDFHVKAPGRLFYDRVDTAGHLARAVSHVLAADPRPDIVVATGDLVDAGSPEEYTLLRRLLAPLDMPVYVLPGNHDERRALAAAFPECASRVPDGGFFHYVVDKHAVRLIALDTVIPGQGGGEFCAARCAWLDARLSEEPDRPTLVLMHHPPFPTGIAHMDAIGLSGASEMAAVVRRHPQVERVICGHLHRPIQARWGGTVASTAPATAHQVALDLRPDGPSAFVLEPPGYQLHTFAPGVGIVSHTVAVGDYDGPYAYADGRLLAR